MTVFDWNPYLVGGATRPDSITGSDPRMQRRMAALFAAAPPEVQQHLRVTSGYRSPERQQQLWGQSLAKYGSSEIARKWVAPPGRSNHNHGSAWDLKFLNPVAQTWAHENAAAHGLAFPLANEPWHIELAEARAKAPAGGTGGLSYGAAQPNIGAPSAMTLADMFGAPPVEPAPIVPPAQDRAQRQQIAADRQALEQSRRQALFAGIGDWFG